MVVQTCSQSILKKSKLPKREIVWIKGNIKVIENQIKFIGNEIIPSNMNELHTPLPFYLFIFFPDELIEKIVNESNLYAYQKILLNLRISHCKTYDIFWG